MDQIFVKFSDDKINMQEALEFVRSVNCGAISMFIGTTRINENEENLKKVSSLFYEAYEEMALKIIQNIVEELLATFNDGNLNKIYICHKIGHVALGESSLIIAVSSPHRLSGHQLVMDILNQIKQKAPVWKKVCYQTDHSSFWSENSEAFWIQK